MIRFVRQTTVFLALAPIAAFIVLILLTGSIKSTNNITGSFVEGTPGLRSAGALAFAPGGILFIGDSQGAAVFAIDVNDNERDGGNDPINIEGIDAKIAAMLGTTPEEIHIHDMVVHPTSQKVYLSVSRGYSTTNYLGTEVADDAHPFILCATKNGKIEEVPLENIRYSKANITNPPGDRDRLWGINSRRTFTITDLAYAGSQLYIAGLSNEEFASKLHRISFPFKEQLSTTSIETFHTSHGRYETHAPIRTFLPEKINNEMYILAAYTCTPLVVFPVNELSKKTLVKGKTIAELGSRNTPQGIISYEKAGKTYILIANNHHPLMKINLSDITNTRSLVNKMGRGGVDYTELSQENIMQLENLNQNYIVVLQHNSTNKSFDLRSISKQSL